MLNVAGIATSYSCYQLHDGAKHNVIVSMVYGPEE